MTKNLNTMEAQMMNAQLGMAMGEQIRRIIVAGPISDEMAAYFLDQITALEYTNPSAGINVFLNTPGGSVSAALAMMDAMTTCACPVKTIGMGLVASAGVLLLACGCKGNRVLSPNCRVMIHQASTLMHGNTSELETEMEEMYKIQDIYNTLISKYSGQPVKKIVADMVHDKFMSAQEAIDYGLADKIMDTRKQSKMVIEGPKPKKYRNG